jgi:cbb3-type cytochrome c oxidase subunit III
LVDGRSLGHSRGVLAAGVFAVVLASAQTVPTTIPEMWAEWCARCHAQNGTGKVNEPTITVEPMDFSDCKVATPEPDADWERAIADGGPAVGLSSQMPAFGETLSAEQVRGFVAHLRSFCAEPGWPHGNMNFPRPIFTEKAFPENEFILLPSISHGSDVDILAIYERRMGRRTMWEAVVPFSSHDPNGTVSHVELSLKRVLSADAARTRITSAGMDLVLGLGTPVFEPYLAAGAMWRNLYLQAQGKVELPVDALKAERAFVYNFYVGRDTSAAPNTWTLGLELNGENDEVALTPQLRKGLTKTGALGAAVGVRIPLNARTEHTTRVVAYLLWEYLDPVRARP